MTLTHESISYWKCTICHKITLCAYTGARPTYVGCVSCGGETICYPPSASSEGANQCNPKHGATSGVPLKPSA